VRWKILFYHIPQFIYESTSERIIEIGPHLPKLSYKNESGTFFMALGVYSRWTGLNRLRRLWLGATENAVPPRKCRTE